MKKNSNLRPPLSLRIKKRLGLVLKKKNTVISLFILGIVLAAIISFLLPKLYRSTSKVFFKYNTVNSTYLSKNGSLDNEIRLLNSDEFLKNVVKSLAKKGIPISINDILETRELVANEAQMDLQIVNNDPNDAAEVLNTITQNLSEKSLLKSRSSYLSILKAIDDREKLYSQNIIELLAKIGSQQIC